MENPNYYAILPANVRYDKNLKPMEKILYAEITALSQKDGACYANNTYFSSLYNTAQETVSRWISNLEKNGYLSRQIIYKKGTKIIEKRYLTLLTKKSIPPRRKSQYPIDEKVKDNNTSINNTRIIEDSFEKLWIKYGKVGSKSTAKKKYLSKSFKYSKDEVLLAIERYLKTVKDKTYQKHFSTFLNSISDWIEDYEESKNNSNDMEDYKILI